MTDLAQQLGQVIVYVCVAGLIGLGTYVFVHGWLELRYQREFQRRMERWSEESRARRERLR